MKIILWILTVYAVICVVAYFGNRRYMYFPDPARTAPTEAGLNSIEEVAKNSCSALGELVWESLKTGFSVMDPECTNQMDLAAFSLDH